MMTEYFATVARGLEPIAAQELERLGAQDVRPDFTGVHFSGDRALLYRVNLWGRTLFRVLVPIREFSCPNAEMLYREVQSIDWEEYLDPGHTLAVNCTGSNHKLNHTHFTALQVKNAIVDQQRDRTGERSTVDPKDPDLLLNLHIHGDRAILSLDSSGNSLHRRGYRPAMGTAPLKETLAAAILELAEYSPEQTFLDPLCGSGTLPLEAGLKALNIAPGLFRERFGFMSWRDFDLELWQDIRQEALDGQKAELTAPIFGSDRDRAVIQQAHLNAENCGLDAHVHFSIQEFYQIEPPAESGIFICNPPYGERLGEVHELGDFYKSMGDILKQRFTGWTAYILSGNKELTKKIGLKSSKRIPVYNGSLPCTLLKYELY
ncbi:putative N6-adenine-specific DNA methylase [Oscillatoria acuminata PCC 6304]|uniref:Putative N6-adenine-specific DNA methylase n=2 Tax=Oscillatoria acuminata TaxID=118323 RepID=K9TL57_9CYAN|nr:putative N6-adenine-specific DNA methylase [Oscillatoria acuminata PCC 6304]